MNRSRYSSLNTWPFAALGVLNGSEISVRPMSARQPSGGSCAGGGVVREAILADSDGVGQAVCGVCIV